MTDEKITDLASQTGASVASGDLFETVDVSDASMAATGTNKKITANEVAIAIATLLSLASTYQPLDSDLTAIAALTTTATGRSLLAAADAAAIRVIAGAVIGTNVQAFDSHYLLSNTTANLTAGFNATDFSAGTKSSGTFTPDPANGNFQTATNGGAHTLAAPGSSCTMIIVYTNNGSAGTITTSGYTKVNGDSLDTTNAHIFLFYITKIGSSSLLTVKAMQ